MPGFSEGYKGLGFFWVFVLMMGSVYDFGDWGFYAGFQLPELARLASRFTLSFLFTNLPTVKKTKP